MIAVALKAIWLEKPETASRIKLRIHTIMAWGWAHDYCQSNPVDVVDKLLAQQPSKTVRQVNQPAIDWRIIPSFLAENINLNFNNNENYLTTVQGLLLFIILTASRSGEARGATWDEIDFANPIWEISATRMKMKQGNRVPLSKRAIQVLDKMKMYHPTLIFPTPRKQSILSDMAVTKYLRTHQTPSTTKDRIATAHGFRSSFRDWCSEHQYPRDLAARALAHTISNEVEAAYHRTDLLEQRRPMMQVWREYVFNRFARNYFVIPSKFASSYP